MDYGLFDIDERKGFEIVENNKKIFNDIIMQAEESMQDKNYEMASRYAYSAANFAGLKHPGCFTSPKLEMLLLECGNHLPGVTVSMKIPEKKDKRRVFHIMSEGYFIGGHTRLVRNWIEKDKDSIHYLITTWQIKSMPQWVIEAVAQSGGHCISLDSISDSYIDRAAVLREITMCFADIVVCHMHMHDPIPVMAFGIEDRPPVIYLNHGDHVFWLGSSISDIVCDLRPAAQRLTLKRRNVQNSCLLPIPLTCPQNLPDKNLYRKELDLPETANIIVSIASHYKYNSFSRYDFTDFLKSILQRNINSKVVVVGPYNTEKWVKAFRDTNGGIMAVGPQSEIEKYYSCADIYLDPYMFCSMTSAMDAGLRGIPLAYLKNSNNELLSCNDISLEGLNNGFYTIKDYLEYIDKLLKDKEFAVSEGKALSDSIKEHHVYLWEDYLNKAYKLAQSSPRTINLFEFKDEIGMEDLFLALFQDLYS